MILYTIGLLAGLTRPELYRLLQDWLLENNPLKAKPDEANKESFINLLNDKSKLDKAILNTFNTYDKNSDGAIDPNELTNLIKDSFKLLEMDFDEDELWDELLDKEQRRSMSTIFPILSGSS